MSDPVAPPGSDSVYRLAVANALRVVGPLVILLGVFWVVLAVIGASRAALWGGLALTVVDLAGCVWLLARPPIVLRLSDEGYRLGLVRTAGAPSGAWRDVEQVGTADVAGGPALVFSLRDGGQTVLPLGLLGAQAEAAQRDVHERLNRAYGYRRLDPPA